MDGGQGRGIGAEAIKGGVPQGNLAAVADDQV